MLRITAPAKINLHLAIGARRADGYHELVGVFHALELADGIWMEPADGLIVECDADVGAKPRHNLAYRAAEAMGAAFEREPAVRIVLEKRIPHGAGLGGGSSDAAAVIAGLATMWGVDAEDPRCRRSGLLRRRRRALLPHPGRLRADDGARRCGRASRLGASTAFRSRW